jgi:serine/threonine-protein kinase
VSERATIELRVLGSADLRGVDPARADALLVQVKAVAALAYLALAPGRALVRRDRLAGLLWPELDDEHARPALRKVVQALRQTLGDDALVRRGDEELALSPVHVWCDAEEMRDAVPAGRLARALELYARGELLPGFFVPQATAFEDWLSAERRTLRDMAAAAAWGLAARCSDDGERTVAGRWARHAARYAPDDERMLRRVLELLAGIDDVAGAAAVYEDFARRLRRDHGAEPSAATRAVMERLRAR